MIARLLYPVAVRALRATARATAPLWASGRGKVVRGLRGRREAAERLVRWSREGRRPEGSLVWIHAPSVGEGLQAETVVAALRSTRPELQFVFTHFSPSAEGLAGRMKVDTADYLPWDVASEVGPLLDALQPDLLVFTKTEVWPVLTREAERREIPVALVAATLPEASSRRRWPARAVLGPALRALSGVLAIAPEDATRLVELGAPLPATVVTGDPGIDSAAERAMAADQGAPYLAPFRAEGRPTLVAGSTWPTDEGVLVTAATRVRRDHPDLRVVVAPHEPTAEHVEPLEGVFAGSGWAVTRLSEVERSGSAHGADAVVVDRVGVLAHLYTIGTMAYVGGGFHGAGLHSVLEPAASGLPVVFGSRYASSRAAADLLECGGARVVHDAAGLEEVLREWLSNEPESASTGRAAAGYIENHRGAAERTASYLLDLLDPN